jgi:actin-related protein 3
MGFAGNVEPQFIIPTAIATKEPKSGTAAATPRDQTGIGDLDFHIGEEAFKYNQYELAYPIRHGQIDNWTHIEQYWEHCIFKYLRCEPEDHFFCLVFHI